MPEPEDLPLIAGVIAIVLVSLAWHEAAHAWVADRLGDPTARRLGRVSLNPLRHIDPFLTILLPVLMFMATGIAFGGGKPVPINPMNFRNKARDFMLVAVAGPGSNLLLVVVFGLVYVVCAWTGVLHEPAEYQGILLSAPLTLSSRDPGFALALLQVAVLLNLLLAFFNMLPIPPLDGSRVVGWLLPRSLQPAWYRLDRFGIIILIALLYAMGGAEYLVTVFQPVWEFVYEQADRLAGMVDHTT